MRRLNAKRGDAGEPTWKTWLWLRWRRAIVARPQCFFEVLNSSGSQTPPAATPCASFVRTCKPLRTWALEQLNHLSTAEVGQLGENLASWLLQRQGQRLLGARVPTPFAEVDLWFQRGRQRVCVEVKTRRVRHSLAESPGTFGPWLSHRQRARLLRAAAYLGENRASLGLGAEQISNSHHASRHSPRHGLECLEIELQGLRAGIRIELLSDRPSQK